MHIPPSLYELFDRTTRSPQLCEEWDEPVSGIEGVSGSICRFSTWNLVTPDNRTRTSRHPGNSRNCAPTNWYMMISEIPL